MRKLLLEINKVVDDAGGRLSPEPFLEFSQRYKILLDKSPKKSARLRMKAREAESGTYSNDQRQGIFLSG